jgi:hypothetical protein
MLDTPLLEVAKQLDRATAVVVDALVAAPDRGRWEAEVEANVMIALNVRHAEAITALAREGYALYPAAMTLSRAGYESGIRILWMLYPDEPFERERRWLSHLRKGEEHYERFARRLERLGGNPEQHQKYAESLREFRLSVTEALPPSISPPGGLPDLAQMLEQLGDPGKYLMYMLTSQYLHGSYVATELYRRNLGTNKETGEFFSARDWHAPMKLAWFSLEEPVARLLECLDGDSEAFRRKLPRRQMAIAFQRLEREPPSASDDK